MKAKKSIIGILILFVLIIIILICVLLFLKKNKTEVSNNNNIENNYEEDIQSFQKTASTKVFFTVDDRIKAYMLLLKNNSNTVISYLNDNYIKSNDINENNIFQKISTYQNYDSYITSQIYEAGTNEFMSYLVMGRIDGKEIFFNVNLDTNNKTFDIIPLTQEQYEIEIKRTVDSNDFDNKKIESKQYNFFNYKGIEYSEEVIARHYYAEYLRAMLVDSQVAYDLLDDEYKNAKFSTIDTFREYITNNREKIQTQYNMETSISEDFNNFNEYDEYKRKNEFFALKSYAVEKYSDYTQYICVDGHENYFIFNVKYPGEYVAILDKYSIDTPNFIKKYNSSTDSNKVAMNAEKVRNAINCKDYGYVYNKLDETFKQDYYPTLEVFKEYLSSYLYEYNTFNYSEATKESDVYILAFDAQDLERKTQYQKNGTIVMKLKEGTDFVMSFNFE